MGETADRRVDAYFWLKTPGESDGCTEELPDSQGKCPRFDKDCASEDSIGSVAGEPRAPEAGLWFHYQIKELASNAAMGNMTRFHATALTRTDNADQERPRCVLLCFRDGLNL